MLALFVGLWLITARKMPVRAEDRALIVSAWDISSYFELYEPSKENELIEKTKYIDGLEELTYEYDSSGEDAPYISITISDEASTRDAALTYAIEWSAQKFGFGTSDHEIIEDNKVYSVGK